MYFLVDFIRETVNVFLITAPFLLFGFFLAGVLNVLIPRRWLRTGLGKSDFRSVFLASLTGVPLPLCSCSVLPTAVALRQGGASQGATVSFLISTPETGVDSISITYALLDPVMTVARPLAAFGTAMVAGVAVNALEPNDVPPASERSGEIAPDSCGGSCEGNSAEPLGTRPEGAGARTRAIFSYAYGELLDGMLSWFIVGLCLTGLIGALVPDGALEGAGLSGFSSMLVMLVIGIPLYVCATGSTPIAAMLILKGLNPGAALVFLLAGPATNATALIVLTKTLGKRVVAIYLLSIAILSLVAGALVNAIYSSSGISPRAVAGAGSEILPAWLRALGALCLLALMLRSAQRVHLLRGWRKGLQRLGKPVGLDLGSRAARAVYILLALVLYLLTGWSTVGPGETGWVLTFGKVTRTVTHSGLVVHLPYPFARLEKEQPLQVRSIDRGYRAGQVSSVTFDRPSVGPAMRELTKEAEVATGDENLLAVSYSVQYAVADPYAYHFAMANPDTLMAGFAEYAVRRVLCEEETDSILVNHRLELQQRIAARLRTELGAVGAGIEVLRVDLVDLHAPAEVHFAFRDVASAMEDNHRFIRQSESYRNRVVAAARGQAVTITTRAEGDKLLRVAAATGGAFGFTALEQACRRTMPITRVRLYLDAAAEVLPRARLILPLTDLPLDLWISRGGMRSWPEPFGGTRGTSVFDRSIPTAPSQDTGTRATETWREKMNRLQERDR